MNEAAIVSTIQRFHPEAQALYLFGSSGTVYERADSDVDLALLLPPGSAKKAGSLMLKDCWSALTSLLNRPVDLINLRLVNTVFQHQIVQTGRLIWAADKTALETFEMLTLSFYQKLEEERAPILSQIFETKRILNP